MSIKMAQRFTGLVEAHERGGFVAIGDYLELRSALAERDAEIAALKADAGRYRYLRDAKTIDQWIWDALEHTEGDELEAYQKGLDAAVDEAIHKGN